jgi:hypothetical protein
MPDRTTMQDDPPSNARRMRFFVFEYLAPLLAALGLTIVLTWPLPRYFVHSLIQGITLTTNSIGPFSALFALPFW